MTDLTRARTVFALEKMPASLRSDVLADGNIAARLAIPVHSPVQILDKIIALQELLARFREVADGQMPSSLLDLSGADQNARIEVDEKGDGSVRILNAIVRFPGVALLTSDPAKRIAWAELMLGESTLSSRHASEFLTLVAQPALSDKDFVKVAALLSAAPEFFAHTFREKLERTKGSIGQADLLPDDPSFWENLIARGEASPDLQAFIATELAAERKRQLNAHPLRAYRAISLSFCAPALVPRELLDELPVDTVVAMIEQVLHFDDPFAVVGSFEYCATTIQKDSRFAVLGEKLLVRLVADMDRLQRAAAMWAAAFVIATAHLAVKDQTKRQPVYWRRLSAASHASLVVRTCGVHDIDPTGILHWAIEMRGLEYHCSILLDMAVEPRWRPEWANPGIVTANIFSRAYGAYRRMPTDVAPAAWGERLSKGKAWIDDQNLTVFLTAPGVLEGGLRCAAPPIARMDENLAEVFHRFTKEPDLENLVAASAASQRVGVPHEIIPSLMEALARIKNGTTNLDDAPLRSAMAFCAHLALLVSDGGLADAVAQTVLDCVRGITRREAVSEAAFRIIEVSGAIADPAVRQALLCRGFLALANILPADLLLDDLAQVINALTRVNPSLAAPLGRAIHTARLGSPSSPI